MASRTFKVGDIVTPIGGGPDLLITNITPSMYYCETCHKSNLSDGNLDFECVWFQKDSNGVWIKDEVTFNSPDCFKLVKKG